MTLATEIASVTSYNSTDISNAVTEATLYCAMHDETNDEIIKSAAIWLLDRLQKDRQAQSNPAITVPSIRDLHEFIESIKGQEVDTSTRLVAKYKSPTQKGLSAFTW